MLDREPWISMVEKLSFIILESFVKLGQSMVDQGLSISHSQPPHQSLKAWSKHGQSMVRAWSKHGQSLVIEAWSKQGQSMVIKAWSKHSLSMDIAARCRI